VALYVLTAVGRIHQLFGALEALHLAALAGVLAIGLYAIDRDPARRAGLVRGATPKLVAALLLWMMASVPFALNTGASVDAVFNNLLKTAIMSFVVAGAVRNLEDMDRLAFVYFAGAVIYATVVITRFNLGDGGNWRLGKLYYYDANDFATFVVTAIPFGIYFLHAAPKFLTRMFAAGGLVVLSLGFVWSGSRGGFIALAAVALYILFRYSAIPLRWRVEQALGVLTTRNRRLVRDWEQLPEVSETVMVVANLRRLTRAVARLR